MVDITLKRVYNTEDYEYGRGLFMEYRQLFDKKALLKLKDIDEALDDIRAELAENLLNINNTYCEAKYEKIADVFWGFPASKEYDNAIADIVPLGNSIISLGYGADGTSVAIKCEVLELFFEKREELKSAMQKL